MKNGSGRYETIFGPLVLLPGPLPVAFYLHSDRRQEDSAGRHADEVEVTRRLRCQQDARRRTELQDVHLSKPTVSRVGIST
jgi:hypothetical protein